MSKVTLIGERLAEPGTEFTYHGEAAGCAGCPYRGQCLNLEKGVRYQVTGVRNAQTLDCALHDVGVTAVEVEPAPVTANVDSREAFAGSNVSLEGPCPYTECPSHEYCEPAGAEFDESYQIAGVLGDPPHEHCMLGRDLTLVEFAPTEE
jgi:uncharacterized protein (UPF0179 family)